MSLKAFRGGIHPPEQKISSGQEIQTLDAPEMVYLPISQHIGAPANPIVKTGDSVKIGDVIAEAGGFVSVPIHASVSGKVKKVEQIWHFTGRKVDAISIQNDGEDTWNRMEPIEDPFNTDPKVLKDRAQACGLVGMGGATFPTHVKLSPPPEKPIDAVIINGVECEPYLTADHRLMLEDPESVLDGARILAHILGAKKVYVGIEANKPDAISKMKSLAGTDVEIVKLHVRYPQGAEKQLIHAILGRDIPSGGLPMDVGALVQNVSTASALSKAVRLGTPLVERIVTVTGKAIAKPSNLKVRLGTQAQVLVDACGGFSEQPEKIISGGPMMGFAMHSLESPIVKGSSGLLLLTADQVPAIKAEPCIRCGTCVRNCPMGLEPTIIARWVEKNRMDEVEAWDALDCIECGCCSYGCPSSIPLVQLIRYGKSEVLLEQRRRKGELEKAAKEKLEKARVDK